VVVDDMLFCIVTFNLWLHFNKLLTYLHQQYYLGHFRNDFTGQMTQPTVS